MADFFDRLKTKFRNRNKIFVIGFNKTGTTSIQHALSEFDILMGNQRKAELLMPDVISGNYHRLFAYCNTAEAFQDVPFSKPGMYKLLDKQFPDSLFILTIRDNGEQWFQSLRNFHSKLVCGGHKIPDENDLKNYDYVYKGWLHIVHTATYGNDLYDKDKYIDIYNRHNEEVVEYFKSRPQNLLVINVSQSDSYKKLCSFIGQKPLREHFEWKNKTSEIKK